MCLHSSVYKYPVRSLVFSEVYFVFKKYLFNFLFYFTVLKYSTAQILCFLFGQLIVFPLVCISCPLLRVTGGIVVPCENRTDLFFQDLDVLCCCDSTQCCEFFSELAWTQGKEKCIMFISFLLMNLTEPLVSVKKIQQLFQSPHG